MSSPPTRTSVFTALRDQTDTVVGAVIQLLKAEDYVPLAGDKLTRISKLIEWADRRSGPGLDAVMNALASAIPRPALPTETSPPGRAPAPPPHGGGEQTQVRILFLAANPSGTTRLALDKESKEIDQRIREGDCRDAFDLEKQFAVTPSELQGHLLRYKPQIVHFSGHGSPSAEIVLEDNQGRDNPVSKAALAGLFKVLKREIRVVVLNACYAESQAEAIVEHIDFAIGMSDSIGDKAAIVFAASFYRGLAYGSSVLEAFDLGVNALQLEGISEDMIPRLHSRVGTDAAQVHLAAPSPNPRQPLR